MIASTSTNHVDQGWERPRGTRESLQEARNSHGGGNASKVPPGPGFRVYIDRLQRAAGSRSEGPPGRLGRQAGQQTGMAGPAATGTFATILQVHLFKSDLSPEIPGPGRPRTGNQKRKLKTEILNSNHADHAWDVKTCHQAKKAIIFNHRQGTSFSINVSITGW